MLLILRDDRQEVPWWERGNLSVIPAPSGLTSNFVDPPSKAFWDIVTQTVCLTIATLVVAIRIYTKCTILRNLGWDDYTSCLAWLGLIAIATLYLEEDRHGNGRHMWDITGDQFTAYAKITYAMDIFYNPTIFFTKASILLFFLRAFNPVHRTCVILHIVLWANFVFYFVAIFVEAFHCSPVQKAWLPLLSGRCINQQVAQTSSATINAFSDFVILVLPLANVWGLQLYKKARVGLVVIFSFGALACVASVLRLVRFAVKYPMIEGAVDETWYFFSLGLISTAEVTCGIVCGCLPAFPAFIRHVFDIINRVTKTSHDPSRPTFASLRPKPRLPKILSPPERLTVLSPSSRDSTFYKSRKLISPVTTGWKDGKGGRRDQWQELSELEYVAGDDKRYSAKESSMVEPQPPQPILKREELK